MIGIIGAAHEGFLLPRSARGMENAMLVVIQLEASRSGYGSNYRLTFGLFLPRLASMFSLLSRLF
jgi:hypothetical protein